MRSAVLFLAWALIGGVGGAEGPGGAERIGDYFFSMNGKPFTPRIFYLHGEPGKPAPGDLIRLGWMYVPLGEEKDWILEENEKAPYGVQWMRGGRLRWLAASTDWNYDTQPKTVLDGLAKLSPEELKDLRAVSIQSWNDQVAREFALLDGDRVSILFDDDALSGTGGKIPALPAGLRYIFFMHSSHLTIQDFGPVGKLQNLELFDLDGDLDLKVIESLANLRFLRTSPGATVRNMESIGKLKALRHLDLEYCKELTSLDLILPCRELRVLVIGRTGVRDLSKLAKFPHLFEVDADEAPVSKLPAERMPALREIHLVNSKLTEKDLEAFRKINPGCTVYPQGTEALRIALKGIDLIRLRCRNFDNRGIQETSVDVTDRKSIEEFVAMISIKSVRSWSCGCIPDTFIDFFRGNEEVGSVVVHHGYALVSGILGGEGILDKESAERIVGWLYDHGAKNPRDEIESDQARGRAEKRKTARCMQGLPENLQEAFQLEGDGFGEVLRKASPKRPDQIRVLLRILGADNGPWNRLEWQEQIADRFLRKFPVNELETVCEKVLLGADRQARRGAARFFVATYNSPIDGWIPEEPRKAYGAIIAVEAEARSSGVRQMGLRSLRAWAQDLEPSEVDRRLEAGLRDPKEQVRRAAIIIAGEMAHRPSEKIILQVLQERPVETIPLPEVPDSEKEDVENGLDEAGGKAETRDLAALALGYLESAGARPLIEARAGGSDFCRVALALYGRPELLRAEDFKRDSDHQAFHFAAVEAVIRGKGRVGLDLVLRRKEDTHWWEEERVTKRILDMLLRNDAPGEDELMDAENLAQLRAWFDHHGAEYIESLKK